MLKRLIKEPLIHFFILGALIFALYAWVGNPDGRDDYEIVVSEGKVQNLVEIFTRTWQRPPTPQELQGLIDAYIRDEIFYREGLAMGLDQNDTVIRRRLGQKYEFVMEDLADAGPPSDAQLRKFFQENAEKFQDPIRLSFEQVFLDPNRAGPDVKTRAQDLLTQLGSESNPDNLAQLSDASLFQARYDGVSPADVERDFGKSFAQEMVKLSPEEWVGPIPSAYGSHLVRVLAKQAGDGPDFAKLRPLLEREWKYQRAQAKKDQLFQKLRKKYQVIIEPKLSQAPAQEQEGGS